MKKSIEMISSGTLIEENFEKFKNYKGEKIPTKMGIILRKVIPTNLKVKRDTMFVRSWATRVLKADMRGKKSESVKSDTY